jgi:hypothetical protein
MRFSLTNDPHTILYQTIRPTEKPKILRQVADCKLHCEKPMQKRKLCGMRRTTLDLHKVQTASCVHCLQSVLSCCHNQWFLLFELLLQNQGHDRKTDELPLSSFLDRDEHQTLCKRVQKTRTRSSKTRHQERQYLVH